MVLLCPPNSFRCVCALQELPGLASPHIQGITTLTSFMTSPFDYLTMESEKIATMNSEITFLAGPASAAQNWKNVLVIVFSDIIGLIPFLFRLFLPVLWIRIRFRFWIRFRIQGFDDQKLKKIQLTFFLYLFDKKLQFFPLGLLKGRPSHRRSLSPPKRTSSTSKNEIN